MPTFRTGLAQVIDEPTAEEKLAALLEPETDQVPPGFKKLLTPEGDPYYVPTGLSQPAEELPIPEVSLPDVPKEPITEPEPLPPSKPVEVPTKPSVYDVTPPETVPETPNEQLEKLKPPETTEPAPPPEPLPVPQPITEPEPLQKALETLTKGFFGIRKATEPLRQVVAKPAGAIAAIPWMVPAGFEAIRGLQHYDETERKISRANAEWLKEQGIGAYKAIHKLTGAEVTPETGVEYVAGQLGSSVVPGSKAATAGVFGVGELMRYLQGDPATMSPEDKRLAEARGRVPKWLAEQLLSTPAGAGEAEDLGAALEKLKQGQGTKLQAPGGTATAPAQKKGKGKGPTMVPVAPEQLQETPVKPGKPEMPTPPIGAVTPDSILRIPRAPKPPVPKKDELPAKFLARQAEYEKKLKEFQVREEEYKKQFNPTAVTTMRTVGGMKEVKESDLWGMGIMAIGTAGFVATPYVYRMFRQGLMPRPVNAQEAAARARPVAGAPEGTITNVNTVDMLKASTLDINLALVQQARKAMMDINVVDNLEQMLRSGGHTQGQALIDSAIRHGKLRTNTLDFETPHSLEKIGRAITQAGPDAVRYLVARDVLERINLLEQTTKYMGNKTTEELAKLFQKVGKRIDVTVLSAKAGPDADIKINGLDKFTALDIQSALEKMHPEYKDIGKMWDRWNIDKRKFMAEGEASTLPKDEMKVLNAYNKSEIPWGAQVGADTPFETRVSQTNILDAQNYRSRVDFKERMQNEIKLYFTDQMRALNEGYATTVSQKQYNNNPEYDKYVTTIYRGGKAEHVATDRTTRDFLNLDPYIIEQGFSDYMNKAKRLVESVYTGNLNPAFAITNSLRLWHNAKQTVDTLAGRQAPSLWGMAKSVPEQVYPQLAKFLADTVEEGGGKRMSQFFGKFSGMNPQQAEAARLALGRRWAAQFDDHTFAMIEQHGGARGSLLEQQHRTKAQADLALAKGDEMAATAGAAARRYWDYFKRGYTTSLSAVHEASQYAYVKKNMDKGVPLDQIISEARNLGGDPKIGGQYRFREGEHAPYRRMAFEGTPTQEAIVKYGVRPVAGAAEWMRAGPWGNAIMQSVKRVADAYLENPALFTARVYAYTVAPSAGVYMWNYQNGLDPNGRAYTDYAMNGRHKYATMTQAYLAWPGQPAENGISLPIVGLEFALPWAMTQVAMDHMFGQNKLDLKTDMKQALFSAADISINVPLNPFIAMWEVLNGRIPPMNIIGGESFKPSKDPYDQYRTMPESIERFVRQLGGIGDAVGSGWAAYSHTEDSYAQAVKNGLGAAAMSQIKRVPIMNNLFDAQPKISGSNKITEEFFHKQKSIDTITKHYTTKYLQAGMINTDPASKQGGEAATMQLGPPIPPITPGPPQPPPNSPQYNEFMATVYARFKRDNPGYSAKGEDLGGIGFISLLRRWGDSTAAIRSMEYVDAGLHPKWQKWLNDPKNEELKTWLKDAGVDQTNIRAVKNVFETKRQAAGLTLLYYINAVENELTAKARLLNPNAGPVRLEDIDPYIYGGVQVGPGAPSQFQEAFQ